jgi:hypothetical protein
MIRLQFVRGRGLSSAAIAWMSAGLFSHVDAILPDGSLLGSRSDRILGIDPGVRVRPPAYEKWPHRVIFQLSANDAQAAAFYDFLNGEIGKPYDKLAILGFAIARNWREEGAWFCSELVAAGLEFAGVCPKLYTPSCKVTPVCLSTVISALGGRKILSV